MKLRVLVEERGYDVEVEILDGRAARPARTAARAVVPETVLRPRPPQTLPEDRFGRSPIAGRVAAVCGAVGAEIRRNQPVVVLEAMKMEVPIAPAVDGTLRAIHVQPGDVVAAGQVLFQMDPRQEPALSQPLPLSP